VPQPITPQCKPFIFDDFHIFYHETAACTMSRSEIFGSSFGETSVNLYQTTWRHITDTTNLRNYRRKSLKSHTDGYRFHVYVTWES
jgi:hypothetical protein